MSRRPTRAARHRAQLTLRIGPLERMESRSLATESLSVFAGVGFAASALVARPEAEVAAPAPSVTVPDAPAAWPAAGGEAAEAPATPGPAATVAVALPTVGEAPSLAEAPQANTITVARAEIPTPQGGGGVLGSSHGGSGAVAPAPSRNESPTDATPPSALAPYQALPAYAAA